MAKPELISSKLKSLAKKYPSEVKRVALATVDLIVARLESEVVEATPTFTEMLRGSIFGETQETARGVKGIVGTPAKYAEVVEVGRQPKARKAPLAPLELWVRRKLRKQPPESVRIAAMIRNSMYWHGTKGKFMFKTTWSKNLPWIQQRIGQIPNEVRKLVGEA